MGNTRHQKPKKTHPFKRWFTTGLNKLGIPKPWSLLTLGETNGKTKN